MIFFGTQVLYGGEHERGLYMIVLGSISKLLVLFDPVSSSNELPFPLFPSVFIPGSYASYILYGAYRGWNGYHYDQIPSYDE